jgi:glycosyltransferase involved in cell wall biosynthesis
MKVVILGSLKSPHVKRWAQSLAARGVNIHVISLHKSNEQINHQINVHYLRKSSPLGYITNIFNLKKLLRKISPDIIHSFYALGYGTLGVFSGFKPHILSVMGSDIYDDISNPLLRQFIINNVRSADVVCSTSKTMAVQIERITGVEQPNLEYTPFGIDTLKFQPTLKTDENNSVLTFGTVKFLEDKYGIDILLKSYAKFRFVNPEINSRLVIVGDGSKEHELKELAKRLDVYDFCEFKGYQPHVEIPTILQNFDVYMALSRLDSESFGVAVLEASAVGLPVIVTNVGGLPEVVENNVSGFVIENESVAEAANVMSKLANSKQLRDTMGQNGRQRVIDHYNWEKSVSKMIGLYHDALLKK